MPLEKIRAALAPFAVQRKDGQGNITNGYRPGVLIEMDVADIADCIPGGLDIDPRINRDSPNLTGPGEKGGQVFHELVWKIGAERVAWFNAMNNSKTTALVKDQLRKKTLKNNGYATKVEVDIKVLELMLKAARPVTKMEQPTMEPQLQTA